MTPVETFRRHFRDAVETLERGLPEGAVVYVVSIPDVTKLREAFWNDSQARTVWRAFGVCPAILSERATAEDVETARGRLVAYNQVLREESDAAGFAFDDETVFDEPVRREDVSPLDYFHPSLTGQRRLAEIAWDAGPLAKLQ
jgi:lysophospholipase L1-like esterase